MHLFIASYVLSIYILPYGNKTHFKKNWLIFWGIWGEAELIFRIWGAKAKYFQGAEDFLSGIRGDQYIISRE